MSDVLYLKMKDSLKVFMTMGSYKNAFEVSIIQLHSDTDLILRLSWCHGLKNLGRVGTQPVGNILVLKVPYKLLNSSCKC